MRCVFGALLSCRSWVLVGVFGGCVSVWGQGVFAAKSSTTKPQTAVVLFQELGVSKAKLPLMLGWVRDAYTRRTGFAALSLARTQQSLPRYGLRRFSRCAMSKSCLSRRAKKTLPTPEGLFIGVGGLGSRLHVVVLRLALQSGTEKAKYSGMFRGFGGLRKRLPMLMQRLFPGYGEVQIDGLLPAGAQFYVNDRLVRLYDGGILPVPAGAVRIRIVHPRYQTIRRSLRVDANRRSMVSLSLQRRGAMMVRRTLKRPLRPKPLTPSPQSPQRPWYRHWAVWTAAGIVVVGTGVAIGIAASQPTWPEARIPH